MCISGKILSFNRFLFSKKGLEKIKHRKIVQKIFCKYIPDNIKINLDCSYLEGRNLKKNI